MRAYRFPSLPGGEGFVLAVSNPGFEAILARTLDLQAGLVCVERITVTAAHQSAGEPPSRWLDVADERLYLAPDLGGRTRSSSGGATRTLASGFSSAAASRTSAARSSATDVLRSGNVVDTTNYGPAAGVPEDIIRWLSLWQRYLTHSAEDRALGAALQGASPELLQLNVYNSPSAFTRDEASGELRRATNGPDYLARFGTYIMPLRHVLAADRTEEPVLLDSDWMPDLTDHELVPLAKLGISYIDELLGACTEELALALPDSGLRDAVLAAAKAAVKRIQGAGQGAVSEVSKARRRTRASGSIFP